MKIHVRLLSVLREKTDPPRKEGEFVLELDEGSDLDAIVASLGLPPTLAGVFLVNKRRSPLDTVLREGDRVTVLPRIIGG